VEQTFHQKTGEQKALKGFAHQKALKLVANAPQEGILN